MSENHLSELRFDSLELDARVQAGIRNAGFEFCTPIQASTLPIALAQKDVAGQAQTGTGKTAAFALPLLSRIDSGSTAVQVLVLTPTRELAIQIHAAISQRD